MTNQVWSTDRFPQSPPKQDPNSCTGKSKRRRISTPHCGNIIQSELQILQNQNFLGKRQRWQTSKDAKKCRRRWNFSAKCRVRITGPCTDADLDWRRNSAPLTKTTDEVLTGATSARTSVSFAVLSSRVSRLRYKRHDIFVPKEQRPPAISVTIQKIINVYTVQ